MKFLRRPNSSADRVLSQLNCAFSKVTIQKPIDWKAACHRELKIPYDAVSEFSWRELYASSVDGSHAYSIRNSDKHIEWKRIGGFCIQSGDVLVSGHLLGLASSLLSMENVPEDDKLIVNSSMVLSNIQTGGWIADLNLMKCSLCSDADCEGTMQVLNARHSELFLHNQYRKGEWTYEEIGEFFVRPPCKAASVGIFDAHNLTDEGTQELLKLKSWIYPPSTNFPATVSKLFAAGASTNLEECDADTTGLVVKFYTMKAGKNGAIVAIRITQCLAS